MAGNPFPQSKEQLLQAYRTMRTIREFEERLHIDFGRGDIPGFVHLYAGEEAAGTGIMMHLGDGDRIASTHRGHGHCIAKGVDVVSMMKEIYGKKGGACNGKGGSMHIADLHKGMMGANGILGAGAPLACGADGRADIGAFRQRRVEQPVAMLGVQALGDAEHTTPGVGLTGSAGTADDVLTHHDHRGVARHFLVERLVDRLLHADLASHVGSPQ